MWNQSHFECLLRPLFYSKWQRVYRIKRYYLKSSRYRRHDLNTTSLQLTTVKAILALILGRRWVQVWLKSPFLTSSVSKYVEHVLHEKIFGCGENWTNSLDFLCNHADHQAISMVALVPSSEVMCSHWAILEGFYACKYIRRCFTSLKMFVGFAPGWTTRSFAAAASPASPRLTASAQPPATASWPSSAGRWTGPRSGRSSATRRQLRQGMAKI